MTAPSEAITEILLNDGWHQIQPGTHRELGSGWYTFEEALGTQAVWLQYRKQDVIAYRSIREPVGTVT